MVEITIVPEGVSGLKKTKKKTVSKKPARPTRRQWAAMTKEEKEASHKSAKAYANQRKNKGYIATANDYHGNASKRAKKMQKANLKENKRIGPKQMRKMIRDSLLRSNPSLALDEVEKLVDQNLSIVSSAYAAAKPEGLTEAKDVWDARRDERRRVVRANWLRRKEDQPTSKENLEWMETGRR